MTTGRQQHPKKEALLGAPLYSRYCSLTGFESADSVPPITMCLGFASTGTTLSKSMFSKPLASFEPCTSM